MVATSRGFTARAAVATSCDATGRTRVDRIRSDGPLALRESGGAVYLVGAAAGPLGGDDLRLDIDVGPGSRLIVRSAAASLVLPGESGYLVRARVAAGGELIYAPEPVIVAQGCRHRAVADITLTAGARLTWREQLLLGRHGERPGRYVSRLDAMVDEVPLLRHEMRIDDSAASRAVLGDARAVGTTLLAGYPDDRSSRVSDPHASRVSDTTPCVADGVAVLPLAGPGVLIQALAPDAVGLRRRLDEGEAEFMAEFKAEFKVKVRPND